MTICYVLINAETAHEHDVYNALSKVTEIVDLHTLFGEYDLIAKIEAEDSGKLDKIVIEKIRSITGITNTLTLTDSKF